MPKTEVVFYKEADGSVPMLDWLNGLTPKVRDKCIDKIERLQNLGHELMPPESDYLRDGIYELRTRFRTVRYRMLYFFHGNVVAVVSHGIIKKTQKVPSREIERAMVRKEKFVRNPRRHTREIEIE